MKNIVRVSCILKWVAIVICIGLPIVEAGYWITEGYPFLSPCFAFDPLPSFDGHTPAWEQLTSVQKLLGFGANLLPLAFSVLSLFYLARIFEAFQQLQFFQRSNAALLKRSAMALLTGQLIYPVYIGLLSLALTFNNPVGERTLHIGFGSNQLKMMAVAFAILLVSWILEEGCKLYEENAATI